MKPFFSSTDPCPQTRLVELGSAAVALWWALLLLLPVHLFRTNPAFDVLPKVGPEWRWGLGCLSVGAWQLVGTLRRRPVLRWAGACLSAGLWGGIGACLAEGSRWEWHLPLSTGCGAYGMLLVLGVLCAGMLAPYVLADLSVWGGRWKRRGTAWQEGRRARRKTGFSKTGFFKTRLFKTRLFKTRLFKTRLFKRRQQGE